MDVQTNLKVSQLNVDRINVLSADINNLSVEGSPVASQDFVLDVVALASKYEYKQLSQSDLSLDMFAINRIPQLTAGQELSVIAPNPISGALIEWQMITDLTNLSSTEDPATIVIEPPAGYQFNWLFLDGNTELMNEKKFLSIYQVLPSLDPDKFDIIAATKELKTA